MWPPTPQDKEGHDALRNDNVRIDTNGSETNIGGLLGLGKRRRTDDATTQRTFMIEFGAMHDERPAELLPAAPTDDAPPAWWAGAWSHSEPKMDHSQVAVESLFARQSAHGHDRTSTSGRGGAEKSERALLRVQHELGELDQKMREIEAGTAAATSELPFKSILNWLHELETKPNTGSASAPAATAWIPLHIVICG